MSLFNPEFEKAAKILADADDEVLQAAGLMAQMRLETLKKRLEGVAGVKALSNVFTSGPNSQTQSVGPTFKSSTTSTSIGTSLPTAVRSSSESQNQSTFPLSTPEKAATTNITSTSQTQRISPLSTLQKAAITNTNSRSQTQGVTPKTASDIVAFPELKKVIPKVEPVAARDYRDFYQSTPKKEITKAKSDDDSNDDKLIVPWKKDKDEDTRTVVIQRNQRRLEIDPNLDFFRGNTQTNIFNRYDTHVHNTYIYNQRQVYQPQTLSLTLNSPRGFGGCGCKQIQCNDRRCGCRKSGAACGSGCLCASRGAWCLNR